MADRVLTPKSYAGKPGSLCGNCPYKDQPMLEGGGKPSGVMVVGSHPTKADLKRGKRYTGITSPRLIKQLSLAGILFNQCYVTDVVRCLVPHKKTPGKTAKRCCRPLLEAEIQKCNPHTILTVGDTAFDAFYPGGKLSAYHGSKIAGDTYTLIPMFDPNIQESNPDLLRAMHQDYKGLIRRPPLRPVEGNYQLAKCLPQIVNSKFAWDSETTGLDLRSKLLGISICQDAGYAQYVPAEYVPKGIKFKDTAIMHNAKFDLAIAESNGVCKIDDWQGGVDDTMLLAYCMNRKPLKLKTLAIQELQLEMTTFKEVAEHSTLEDVEDIDVVDYAAADADVPLRLYNHLWRNASTTERNLYTAIERPLAPIMAKMQLAGALVDVTYFERLSNELNQKLSEMYKWFKVTYDLDQDVLTSPTKLAEWLGKLLNKRIVSTNHSALEKLRELHPVISDILKWRTLYKLKTSFVDSILRLQNCGLVFPEFGQTATSTGRMNCSKPNLMQLPKRKDKTVRRGFVAPEGYLVASLDNSQIDMRSLAYLSGDNALNHVFKYDLDLHDETAQMIKGKVTELFRCIAKTSNFLTVFGGGSKALAAKAEIPLSTAEEFQAGHRQRFPGIYAWAREQQKLCFQRGYVETAYGRRRYIPAIWTKDRYSAERQAQNMPVQGTSADIIKLQMQAVVRHLCKQWSVPWCQIHDELNFYIPKQGWKERCWELKKAMETVDAPFKLSVGVEVGPNLGECTKVEF